MTQPESVNLEQTIIAGRTQAIEEVEGVKRRMKEFCDELLADLRHESPTDAMVRDLEQSSAPPETSSFRQAIDAVLIIVQIYMVRISNKLDLVTILAAIGLLCLVLLVFYWLDLYMFEKCENDPASLWCLLTTERRYDPVNDCFLDS